MDICPEKSSPPHFSWVNFSKCLPEEKVDPFAWANTFVHALIVSPCPSWPNWASQNVLCREKLAQLQGWPYTVPLKKGDPSCGANFLFCYVNGLPCFVRKCMKSWLTQGSSGGRVTPLHRSAFLSMIQVKIKFRLNFFNVGWFSISFVSYM